MTDNEIRQVLADVKGEVDTSDEEIVFVRVLYDTLANEVHSEQLSVIVNVYRDCIESVTKKTREACKRYTVISQGH